MAGASSRDTLVRERHTYTEQQAETLLRPINLPLKARALQKCWQMLALHQRLREEEEEEEDFILNCNKASTFEALLLFHYCPTVLVLVYCPGGILHWRERKRKNFSILLIFVLSSSLPHSQMAVVWPLSAMAVQSLQHQQLLSLSLMETNW